VLERSSSIKFGLYLTNSLKHSMIALFYGISSPSVLASCISALVSDIVCFSRITFQERLR
jgi:hypothetical protein